MKHNVPDDVTQRLPLAATQLASQFCGMQLMQVCGPGVVVVVVVVVVAVVVVVVVVTLTQLYEGGALSSGSHVPSMTYPGSHSHLNEASMGVEEMPLHLSLLDNVLTHVL